MSIRINGDNTTAAPGIAKGDDTDTGIQFGTDEVNIVTGGSERVKVDGLGNIGVGGNPTVFTGQNFISVHSPGSSTNIAGLDFYASGTRESGLLSYPSNGESLRIFANTPRAISIHNNGAERLRISAAGIITTPNVPAFQATRSGIYTQSGSDSFIPYNGVRFNNGNHYSTSTYRFTAPVAGIYHFTAVVHRVANAFGEIKLMKNNSTHYSFTEYESFDGNAHHYTCATINMAAGDYVNVRGNNYRLDSNGFFGGFLIG